MALHFTKQQIDEIEQALIARSKKDSQFPGADQLEGTELIPIIQNGTNKVTTYAGLWAQVSRELREYVEQALNTKVDKVEGKELSENDFTDAFKDKLEGVETGAQVNVQSDWTALSGDAFIKNKPDLTIYATRAAVEDIEALIPIQAAPTNQLADKNFVNSSIATSTAEFKGTYSTLAELETVSANVNDYGYVVTTDSAGNTVYDRYKYNGENWIFEYSLNNSSFTAAEWAAIQSGITAALVQKLETVQANAQVNVIEGVRVDGTLLPIVNKEVDIQVSGVTGDLRTEDKTDQEFFYRQTADGELNWVPSTACVEKLKGKTIVWNQVVSSSASSVTVPSGHKYYSVIGGTKSILTSTGSSFSVTGGSDMVIDLTLMFGAGNEPTAVAEFESMFPLSYYDYNAGSLLSFNGHYLKTVGFNLWDEEWESGKYALSGGVKAQDDTCIRSINAIPCLPSTQYYFKGVTANCYAIFFANDGSYLGESTRVVLSADGVFTTPSNAAYFRFWRTSSTTYDHDICINLSSTKNGTYESYKETLVKTNPTELTSNGVQIFPYGLQSAGNVYDEVTETKAIKRIGRVDMGNLNWNKPSEFFYASRFGKKMSIVGVVENLRCSKYETKATTYDNQIILRGDKTIAGYSGTNGITIVDSAYTDATTFKTAMSGVYLNYELATPVVYDLDEPLDLKTVVDINGTEQVYPENTSTPYTTPINCDMQYGIKSGEIVDSLNKVISSDATKADKDTDAVVGNLAIFDSAGNPVDGGMSLGGTLSPVVAAAFAKLQNEVDALKGLLNDYQLKVKAESVDVLEYKIAGMPRILYSSTAGAPSASNVPDNWDEDTMNGWSGVPRFIGQLYLDKPGKKVYFAAAVTNSTSDWVVLN